MMRSRVVATSLLLVVGLALGGQPAFAASHSPVGGGDNASGPAITPPASGQAKANLSLVPGGQTGTSGGILPQSSTTILTNCYGLTNNPWVSGGWAEDTTFTVCPTATSVTLTSAMWRLRWYGPQTLSTDGGYGVTETEANLMYNCSGEGTYSYEVDSSHTAVVGGQTYGAGTVGANRFAC